MNWSVFGKGKNYICKGVSGKRGTRELLFTLPPNFGKCKNADQVEQSKVSKLGTIEVQARSQGGFEGFDRTPQNLTYDAHAQICKARAARALCCVCAGQGENGWA